MMTYGELLSTLQRLSPDKLHQRIAIADPNENGRVDPAALPVFTDEYGKVTLRLEWQSGESQEEIDAHIANDEFQCHKCNEWEDIEDSIEYQEEYYCQGCCVQASCGCLVPKHLVIHHDPGNGESSITCCENCYDRIK